MLALPSPPDDSERTPGTERSTSAALSGAAFLMASPSRVLIETLVFILDEAPLVPVTTTRSMFRPSWPGLRGGGAAHVQDCGCDSGSDAAQFEGAVVHGRLQLLSLLLLY
jgi:hypothetical protein